MELAFDWIYESPRLMLKYQTFPGSNAYFAIASFWLAFSDGLIYNYNMIRIDCMPSNHCPCSNHTDRPSAWWSTFNIALQIFHGASFIALIKSTYFVSGCSLLYFLIYFSRELNFCMMCSECDPFSLVIYASSENSALICSMIYYFFSWLVMIFSKGFSNTKVWNINTFSILFL